MSSNRNFVVLSGPSCRSGCTGCQLTSRLEDYVVAYLGPSGLEAFTEPSATARVNYERNHHYHSV